MQLCECGCGEKAPFTRGVQKRFIMGHNTRVLAKTREWKERATRNILKHNKSQKTIDKTKKRMLDNNPMKNSETANMVGKSLRLYYRSDRYDGVNKGFIAQLKRRGRMNKAEMKLNKFLKLLFPKEYRFVGNGKVFIERRCPDFINVNGHKKIIELFGRYWHKDSDVKTKRDIYSRYGYETLFIWDFELKNEIELFKKLKNFHNSEVK